MATPDYNSHSGTEALTRIERYPRLELGLIHFGRVAPHHIGIYPKLEHTYDKRRSEVGRYDRTRTKFCALRIDPRASEDWSILGFIL